ncbi:MAG: hypothetical protein HY906_22135 [Deltaproteobacteria bacterium]|nr:hypothetical protein [Deltaproteobacteria bacterium]
MRRVLVVLVVLPLLGAGRCGGGEEELNSDEQAEVTLHGSGVVAAHQALVAVDQTMEIDPTLDVTKTPEQNADAIRQRAADGGGCVTATVSGATVTVTFGAGCSVRGSTISGQLSLTVTKIAGTITVVATFVGVEVDGKHLDGSIQLMTTGDGTYQVTFNLTSGDTTVTGDVGLVGAPGELTLSGTLTTAGEGRNASATLTDLHYVIGDCYPSGGTLSIASTRFTGTITFLATTPQDGQVVIGRGRLQTTVSLPAYGSCPPG